MLNAPSFADLVSRVDRRLAPSLAQDWPGLPVVSASGLELNCVDGRTILDFTSGIATTNTGHCHPKVVAAAQHQTAEMTPETDLWLVERLGDHLFIRSRHERLPPSDT